MACINLTSGRDLSCLGMNRGGIKAVGFIEYQEGLISATAGEVASLDPITRIYEYKVKNSGNTWTETPNVDMENRTRSFTQELSLVLQGLDLETRNEYNELTKGDLIIFVRFNNGEILVMGSDSGALVSGGSNTSGGAETDLVGFNITFTATEGEPHIRLSTAAKAEYVTLTQA